MIAQTRPLGEQYNDGYLKSPVLAPAARVDNSHAVSDTVVDVELVEIGTGVATFYGPHFTEGMTTRGGRPYHPDAQIVAVPLELYDELVGEQVKVTNMETGKQMWLEVADSGSGLNMECNLVDLPDQTWLELSGKSHSAGIFQVRLERR